LNGSVEETAMHVTCEEAQRAIEAAIRKAQDIGNRGCIAVVGSGANLKAFVRIDDARLKELRIGLHFIGDDYGNPPPAEALARRGIVGNVIGYSIYGDYRKPNPPARLIEAVAQRKIDAAIAWGPLVESARGGS
jgi:hypothetical protein